MNILVTGAEGFIGMHLVPELLSRNHKVLPIDKTQMNLSDEDTDITLPSYLERNEIDVVIHLAAVVGREFGEDDHYKTVNDNALMTIRVARATQRAGARMLYVSTSEIYGDQRMRNVRESSPKSVPHNLYGLSKRWGEEAAMLYCPDGLQIIRLSMPYGPGLPAGRGRAAIINMLWQAHNRMPIPVHEGAMRSWCWVGDAVRGIATVMERGEKAKSRSSYDNAIGVYNVGSDSNEVSMLHVAELACRLSEAPPALIEIVKPPSNQTVVKRLSMAKLRSIGWEPKISLEAGMAVTYNFIKQYYNENGEIHDAQEFIVGSARFAADSRPARDPGGDPDGDSGGGQAEEGDPVVAA